MGDFEFDARMDGEEEDIFNFTEHRENIIYRMWERTKVAIMGTLFVMGEDIEMGHCMFVVGMAVDFFQSLSFPFNSNSQFPWNEYYSSFFITATNFQEMSVYMSPSNQLQNFIVYTVSFALVLLNLVIAAIVGYKFSNNQVQNPLLLKFVRWVCNLFTTILYLPLLDQFALISSCTMGYNQFDGCPTQLPVVLLAATSLTASLLFGILTFVVVASFYEQDPSSEDDAAKPHARLELLYIIDKAVYTIMFAYFGDPTFMLYAVLVLTMCSAVTCSLYIMLLPVYSVSTAIMQARYQSMFMWAALCLTFCVIENDPDDGAPIILYYIGNVSTFVLAKYACEWRIENLEKKTLSTISNSYEVELVARFMLLKRFKTLNPEHMRDFPDVESTMREIEALYFKAERKFPDSCMLQLFAAQFYMTYMDSHRDMNVKLDKAAKRNPHIDEQFVIYKRRQNSMKNQAVSDVVTFVTFNTYKQAAHKAEINAMNGQMNFWKELNAEDEPSVERMMYLSKYIAHYTGEANTFYTLLMRMNPNDAKLLHSYAFFLSDIINDDEQPPNLHNRASTLDSNKKKGHLGTAYNFDGERVRLLLSVDKGSFARVEYASDVTMELLRVTKSAIYNEKLDSFIAKPIAPEFQVFLKRAMELVDRRDERRMDIALIDDSGYLIVCTCIVRRITESTVQRLMGANDRDQRKKNTAEVKDFQKRIDSSRSSLLASDRDSGGALDQLHVECLLRPIADARYSALVDVNGYILFISHAASVLTGIDAEVCSKMKITEYIFMYDRYFEEAITKSKNGEDGKVIPHPIQTFLISTKGEFSRIKIIFINLDLQRSSLILLKLEVLEDFDEKTQRFLRIFRKFLRAFLEKVVQADYKMDKVAMERIYSEGKGEGRTEQIKERASTAERLFKSMRKKVEDTNTVFSPELRRISQILFITLLLVLGLEIASFILVELLFRSIIDDMFVISISTNIQYYSLSLSQMTMLVDFMRQGATLQPSSQYYVDLMNQTLTLFADDLGRIKDITHISSLKADEVNVLTLSVDWGLQYSVKNPVDACIEQMAHARLLVEGPLSNFDVEHNSDAFFVYENGKRTIAYALDIVSQEAVTDTKSQKNKQLIYMVVFALLQCLIIIIGFALQIPFSLRVESVHFDVISVFFSIPKQVVSLLAKTAKTNYDLMKKDDYPDNKVKKRIRDKGSDSDVMIMRTFHMNKSVNLDDRRKRLIEHYNLWWRKLALLLRNTVAQRVMVCFLFLLAYILILEVYVGQMLAYSQIENGPPILRSIGELKVHVVRSAIAQSEVIYNRPADELTDLREKVAAELNTSFYTIESIEDAEADCFSQTAKIGAFLNMFRVGNDYITIPYSQIYELQKSNFFDFFFDNGCGNIQSETCPVSYGGVMYYGLYDATTVFRRDAESTVKRLVHTLYREPTLVKFQAVQKDFNDQLQLLIENLFPLFDATERMLRNYYEDQVSKFKTIRESFLAVFIFLAVVFYFIFFKRAISTLEKKKQLARSMLLMIPQKALEYAQSVRDAVSALVLH